MTGTADPAPLDRTTHAFTVAGVDLTIAALHRDGDRPPVLFLHGFGSTKEDYADVVRQPAFAGRPILAYDAPGCGQSACSDLSAVDIPFLVEVALAMLERAGIAQCHLVGHSMGGLTALTFAAAHPHRFLSFTSIEGNVAPEDCFLSRQIIEHPEPDPQRFLQGFIARLTESPSASAALFAASLPHKVRADVVRPIFASMVALSDAPGLLDRFLALPFPRLFVYGDENASLSYLGTLERRGVALAEIPRSGHFPMYSNPPALWDALAAFLPDD